MAGKKLLSYRLITRNGAEIEKKGHVLSETTDTLHIIVAAKMGDQYFLFHAPSGLQIAAEYFSHLQEARNYFDRYLADQDYSKHMVPLCPTCRVETEISQDGKGNTATCPTCGAYAYLNGPFYQTYPQEWSNLHFKAPLPKCYTDECSACGHTGIFYQDGKPVVCGYCHPRPYAEPEKKSTNTGLSCKYCGKAIYSDTPYSYSRAGGFYFHQGDCLAAIALGKAPVTVVEAPEGMVEAGTLIAPAYDGDGIIKGTEYKRADGGVDVLETLPQSEVQAVRFADEGGSQALIKCGSGYRWVFVQEIVKDTSGPVAEPEYCACDLPVQWAGNSAQCSYCMKFLKSGTFAPEYGPFFAEFGNNTDKWFGYLGPGPGRGTQCYSRGRYSVDPTQGGYLVRDLWGDGVNDYSRTIYNFRPALADAMAVAEHYAQNGVAEWYAGKGPRIQQPPSGPHIGPTASQPPVQAPEPSIITDHTHAMILAKLDRLQDQFDAFASMMALISVKLEVSFDNLAPVPSLDYTAIDQTIAELETLRAGAFEALHGENDQLPACPNCGCTEVMPNLLRSGLLHCAACGTELNNTGQPLDSDTVAHEPPATVNGDDQAATDTPDESGPPVTAWNLTFPSLNWDRLVCPTCGTRLENDVECNTCEVLHTSRLAELADILVENGNLTATDLKDLLDFSPDWVEWAVVRMAARQTATELAGGFTDEENGIGFSGADAAWGSQMYKALIGYGSLTPRQIAATRKVLGKYVKSQLLGIANHVPSRPIPPAFKKGDMVLHGDAAEIWRVDRVNIWAGVAECVNSKGAVAQFHPDDLTIAPEGYEAPDDGLEEMDL